MRRALAVAAVLCALVAGCHGSTYHGEGDVVGVDPAARQVTINHEDIAGLMPAMTMTFAARSPDTLADVAPGSRVRFDLVKEGELLVVTRLVTLGRASGGRPGIHDHTPHHGGVVGMVGLLHLEALASRAGTVRVYLTDVWRRPLALAGVRGRVILGLPGARSELPLVAGAEALEATGPPLEGAEVAADVRLEREGQPVEMHFVLPLGGDRTGGAAPAAGCLPPEPRPGASGRQPRCVLTFPLSVTAAAATPDGTLVLVAAVNAGVTAWRMPAGELAFAFAAPPPRVVPADEPPHGDAASALAIDPGGREAAVTLGNALLRYEVTTGRLIGHLPAPGNLVRSVAYTPDGERLLVSVFSDPAAHLIGVGDGREVAHLPVELEAAAVACSPDGTLAFVGSETGTVAVFDLAAARPPRLLADSSRPIEALALAGDRLVSAGPDGVLRLWDLSAAAPPTRLQVGSPILRIAVAPGGRIVASAGLDWTIRLHDLASGALVESLVWHQAGVYGLAWAGPVLVSGDTQGRVALWDLAERLRAP